MQKASLSEKNIYCLFIFCSTVRKKLLFFRFYFSEFIQDLKYWVIQKHRIANVIKDDTRFCVGRITAIQNKG